MDIGIFYYFYKLWGEIFEKLKEPQIYLWSSNCSADKHFLITFYVSGIIEPSTLYFT